MTADDLAFAAMRFILAHDAPALAPLVETARVTGRTHTGMGATLELASEPAAAAPDGPLFLGNDVLGVRPGSDDVLRFTLAVEDGRLAWVELFSNNGESLPDDFEDVELTRDA